MSSLSAITLLLATVLAAVFVIMWVTKMANAQRDAIVTGVQQGVPLSTQHRWIIFSNDWIAAKYSMAGLSLILAFAYMRAGQSVGEGDVRLVTFLCAAFAAFSALFLLVLGTSDLIFCVSVLRRAERE
jgi:hypothetical protein